MYIEGNNSLKVRYNTFGQVILPLKVSSGLIRMYISLRQSYGFKLGKFGGSVGSDYAIC